MKTKKKILFRLALLGGAVYLGYKYKDKIVGKVGKLSRMDDMDDVLDDLANTTDKALDGIMDGTDDLYTYILTLLGEEGEYKPNKAYERELNEEVKGLEASYGSLLKMYASNIARDIRNWGNAEFDYQGNYTQKGKMAGESFVNWHNYFALKGQKGQGDFARVTKMINIMLQYKAPFDLEHDGVKDNTLPTVDKYVSNPPNRFLELNDVDWKKWRADCDGDCEAPMYYSLKPKSLFRVLGDRLRNEGLIGGATSRKPTDIYRRR